MNLIDKGIAEGLIRFDEDQNFVTYIHQKKKRNYNNPEEKVQTETFLQLVLIYNYPVERIKQFVSVQMGAETKEADIIVYNDNECETPYILIECKKEEITDQQFNIAVDQAYSYANSGNVQAKYVWVTSKIKNQYYEVVKEKPVHRIEIPDIPQFGVSKLAPYKFVKGGAIVNDTNKVEEPKKDYGQKFFELQVVSESELTKIFTQAHQALWGGFRKADRAFDEFSKLLFCKLWDERKDRKNGDPYDFQIFKGETAENLSDRITGLYELGKKIDKDKNIFDDKINLRAEEIQNVVKYLQKVNLSKTDLDSKGRAFETFMGDHFRGDYGAYFTPRQIVQFIIDSLPIENTSKVLDTSCGSGGFLLHALDKIRRKANEMAEEGYFNKEKPEEYEKWKKYWHSFASNNLFGIELEESIARTAKMNMIIHDDGHTNVVFTDGLYHANEICKISGNEGFQYDSFDFIITNPPFGSKVKQDTNAYLKLYRMGSKDADWLDIKATVESSARESQSTEVLFIEQCHKFLKEHGYLAIVIPDSILTNSSLQYVRDNIEEMYRIVAVVSMPQTAFTATGAGVKSSVLFLRKHKQKLSEKISNKKNQLKEQIKTDNKFLKTVEQWEKEKNDAIKELEKKSKEQNSKASKKEIGENIKEDKTKLQQTFTDKVNLLKEELTEKYFTAKQSTFDDYPIFMAIAEDIGYDATGRNTNNNELIEIGNELAKFINHINKTEK